MYLITSGSAVTWYPSVLVYGIPGTGKTHFVEQEIKKRLAAGHRVIVLDPHAAYGQWKGCGVVGAGLDYEAIDAKLVWFKEQLKDRYKVIESTPSPKFQPLTIVGEEFTNWAKRCENSAEHFQTTNSDICKAECYSIIVSHARTLAGLGDAKGMAALRDDSMLEVEVLGEYDPETERATPRFEAMVKLPGQSLSDRTLVKLVKHPTPDNTKIAPVDDVPSSLFSLSKEPSETVGNVPEQDAENTGTPYGTRPERLEGMLAEILAGTVETAVFAAESPLEQQEKMELVKLIQGATSAIEALQANVFAARKAQKKFCLLTKISPEGKEYPVMIKKKDPANTTRP